MRDRWLIVLALLAAACFFVALDADPSRLLWRDFITDEGWWTGEARDRVLFGHWVMDEYNQGLAVPLATWIWFLAFKLGGVSLWSARLPMALASLLCVLALGLLIARSRQRSLPGSFPRSEMDSIEAGPALLLLAGAIPFALFARLASPESLSLLFILMAWWMLLGLRAEPFFDYDSGGVSALRTKGAARPILAGFLLGAALSAKLSAVVALPAFVWLARVNGHNEWEPQGLMRWRPAVHLFFAALLAWMLLRLPFLSAFAPELALMEGMHRGENLPGSLMEALANVARFPWPSPFLYQSAPLLALAGIGAWQIGLDWRGRSLASQALAFCLLAGLTQSLMSNPADRRFVIFLPALALLAARGWRALASGERIGRPNQVLPQRRSRIPYALWAALAVAFILPGRVAIWFGRLMQVLGRPLGDFTAQTIAALIFLMTLIVVFVLLSQRRHRAGAWLRGALLASWVFVCLEPFAFLIWAGLAQWWGRYDAARVWLECGGWWSIPWGLLTLALVWLPLARGGLLPRLPLLERGRRILPALVPVLGILMITASWARPSFTLRDAAAHLAAPLASGLECRGVLGAEAPSLALGGKRPSTALRSVALRGDLNRPWLEAPQPGWRCVRLMEDSGRKTGQAWPAGADTLALCPQGPAGKAPRFVFAVWECR